MLQSIREKTQGIIATFIVALIAVPFALWGINSYFEGGSNESIAEAGDVSISSANYRQALDRYRGQVRPDVMDSKEFKEMVLRGLIGDELLISSLHEAGYRISDQTLVQEIRSVPAFQRDGTFDPALYDAMVRRQGMTSRDFEQQLRQAEIASHLRGGLSSAGFATPAEVSALLALYFEERSFSYALVSPARYGAEANVTAEAIEQYYKEHSESFQTAEQVKLAYVKLSSATLAAAYKPAEDDVRRMYEESSQFTTPASRRVSHILVEVPPSAPDDARAKAKSKIDELAGKIAAGADFAALAKQHSQDPLSAKKGGDLGEMKAGVLPKELEAAVFALGAGGVTKPVQTAFGWHIAKVTQLSAATRRPFKEVRAEIEQMLRKRHAEERFLEQAERLRNLAYEQAGSLEPAAKALGLAIEYTDWLTRSGGKGIAADGRVVTAAFSPDVLEARHNSEVIELDANTMVVVRVAEHRPAKLKDLAEVRGAIEKTLREREAGVRAKAAAEALLADVQDGKPLAVAAGRVGATVLPTHNITREKTGQTDPALVRAIFAAAAPANDKPRSGLVDLRGDGYGVYILHKVVAGDPAKADDALKERLQRQLAGRFGADYIGAYQVRLQKENPVRIQRDRL